MWCMAPPVASHYVQAMTGSPSDMMLLSGPIQRTQRRPGAVSQKRCDRGDSPASLSPSGRLAQLARASRLHREGRGFKSLNAHHFDVARHRQGLNPRVQALFVCWGWWVRAGSRVGSVPSFRRIPPRATGCAAFASRLRLEAAQVRGLKASDPGAPCGRPGPPCAPVLGCRELRGCQPG
jgi:hypothetical protein